MSGCSIRGCDGKHEARGYCARHYQRVKAHGSPDGGKYHHARSLEQYIEARVARVPIAGCWIWTAPLNVDGYGVSVFRGERMPAHRAAWALKNGPAPAQLNHTCDVRCCVNPEHLYPGTQIENVRDSLARGGRSVRP